METQPVPIGTLAILEPTTLLGWALGPIQTIESCAKRIVPLMLNSQTTTDYFLVPSKLSSAISVLHVLFQFQCVNAQ